MAAPTSASGQLTCNSTRGFSRTVTDRAILYLTAAYTGFRESELASLATDSFDFDATPPTVWVQAAYSKRIRRDVQPLRSDLAELLRKWLAQRPSVALPIVERDESG